jgi:hypothetical protein
MFLVKQSQTAKRKSRMMKAYDWFMTAANSSGSKLAAGVTPK